MKNILVTMRRRARAITITTAVLIILYCVSLRWMFMYYGTGRFGFGIGGGGIGIMLWDKSEQNGWSSPGWEIVRTPFIAKRVIIHSKGIGRPRIIEIALWPVILCAAAATTYLHVTWFVNTSSRKRRVHERACAFCGYDLSSLPLTNVCPECGRNNVSNLGEVTSVDMPPQSPGSAAHDGD